MTECILITTYCNTIEKIDVLLDLIDKLDNTNIDICIHANYPINDIPKKIKYYINNEFNPILTWENDKKGLSMYQFMKIGDSNYKFLIMDSDYGYTPLLQFKEGCNFLINKNYDIIHIFNYDLDFKEDILNNHRELLKYNDGVFYEKYENKYQIHNICFSIKSQFAADLFSNINKNDYANSPLFSEEYFYSKIINYNSKYKICLLKNNLNDLIKFNVTPFNIFTDFFSGFMDDYLTFIFYDSTQYKNIKICINDKIYEFSYKYNFLFKTNLNHSDLLYFIDNDLFSIEIDGIKCDKKIITYIKYNTLYILN